MNTSEELAIPLSKTKLVMITLGCGGFVALGIWLFIVPDQFDLSHPLWIRAVGISSIVVFGLVFLYASKKLFDNSPGLVFNSNGIIDNSSGIAAGLIPWDEITNFSITSVYRQRFLTIHVRNPDHYLGNGNFLRRMANKANLKFYGSPIQISANSVTINFDELVSICQEYFDKYGSPNS